MKALGCLLLVACGGAAADDATPEGARGTWRETSVVGVPAPRVHHSAVWTGSEMLVWGGRRPGWINGLGDGARYDPVRDVWRPMSTEDAPSARHEHGAVWTGSEMVVLGGRNYWLGALGEPGAYDPVHDRWRRLPTEGGPSPRFGHATVWTGSEVLVWGGADALGLLATGARYRPDLDRFAPISTQGAPPPAQDAAFAFSAGRFFVWNGGDAKAGKPIVGGGIYDPGNDAWSEVAQEGAPRWTHRTLALPIGDDILVWGDIQGGSASARYSPGTNTWVAVRGEGAPRQRGCVAAVFTGEVAILFGGAVATGMGGERTLGDGALFDPRTGQWGALGLEGAPSPRKCAPSVWTGTEMIVWGGADDTTVVGTGGRLRLGR